MIRDELLKAEKSAKDKCTSLEQINDVEKIMDMLLPIAEGLDEIKSEFKTIKSMIRLYA